MVKEIWHNLKTFEMFKFIRSNIKELGFWKWFALEFNNGSYSYVGDHAVFIWRWKTFSKSLFNYTIGHPFIGWGLSSIMITGFGMPKKSVYLSILIIVIGEEFRQTVIVKRAAMWWPVDTLMDVATWMVGAYLFNIFNPMMG